MTDPAAELARLTARAERAERGVNALLRASLVPMWGRWSVRIGMTDPMTAWDTPEAAMAWLRRREVEAEPEPADDHDPGDPPGGEPIDS